jgi:putative colanic acid biosynthesis glycosyltransferase
MNNLPLISIITVCYNAAIQLEEAICSVVNQDNSLFEYIIIDGNSTDGTTDLIRKYKSSIRYWISEPDAGIYDAMNKGIEQAKGQWLYFLGADDRLMPGVLNQVALALADKPDVLFGDVVFTNGARYSSKFSWKTILNNTVHHQGTFYKRSLFQNFRYDTTMKIMADYELNLLIYQNNRLIRKQFDQPVAVCAPNGASADRHLSLNELNQLRSRHFPFGVRQLLSALTSVKYFLHYDLLRKIQR